MAAAGAGSGSASAATAPATSVEAPAHARTSDAVLRRESVQLLAQAIGIDRHKIEDTAAQALANTVEYRIREIVQDALKFMKHSSRATLTTSDIDSALRLRNVEGLYGYSSSDPITFRSALSNVHPSNQADTFSDLFFIEDVTLKCDELVNAQLPAAPIDPTFTVHWLAVEGAQPRIPQNPPPLVTAEETKRRAAEEDEKLKEIKPVVKHMLSKEQQLYYENVTVVMQSTDTTLQVAALRSLANDAGLHQLLPYFTQFIADEVTHNLRNLQLLTSLMRMAHALLISQQLHIEPYLHQLMPSILTCLVGKHLCKTPSEDHWSLRDYAASLVALVCQKYGHAYRNLQPRITRTLTLALLDPTKPLTTHYGAMMGLSGLGHEVTRVLLLPNVKVYLTLLHPELINEQNVYKRLEARKCYGALLNACGLYIRHEFKHIAAPGTIPILKAPPVATPTITTDVSMELIDGQPASALATAGPTTASASIPATDRKKSIKKKAFSATTTVSTPAAPAAPPTVIVPTSELSVDIAELSDLLGESLLPYAQPYGSRVAMTFI